MREPAAATRAIRSRPGGRLALPWLLLAGGCLSPRKSIANLDELYESRGGERATHAREITDHGWFSLDGREELDDPVAFAIENLGELARASPRDLDRLERARAIGVAAEIGRIDPSRIVRLRGYETARALWLGIPETGFRFAARPVDEAELHARIDALLTLATAEEARRGGLVAAHGSALAEGALALAEQRPDSFPFALKLLLLATKAGRLVELSDGPPSLLESLERASESLAAQVCFLTARADPAAGGGIADPSPEVRIGAGRLLIAIDPVAATAELGRVYAFTPEAAVRIAWLRALSESRARARGVHPSLRGPLALELEAEDAAVEWWARQALAALLALDAERTEVAELRSRWLALGEWDENGRT